MGKHEFSNGDYLYTLSLRFNEIVEYGVSFNGILSGTVAPPPEGARFDARVTGTCSGPKLEGNVVAVDYLIIRPDGKINLHVHSTVTTADGKNISLFVPGQGVIDEQGLFRLYEMVEHHSSHEEYRWLNNMNAWALGVGNPATGELEIEIFAVR